MSSPSDLGRRGEKIAARHLRSVGMKILGKNYTCPAGEADIIALDRKASAIVVVEVKTRSSDKVVSPVSAINDNKRTRLRRIAEYYLCSRDTGGLSVRFDVISIVMPPRKKPEIQYIRDAF